MAEELSWLDEFFTADGTTETAANVGLGAGQVFKEKYGNEFRLRTIKAGSNVTVTQNVNDITIASTGGSDTGANVGAKAAVYKEKIGSEHRFRTIEADVAQKASVVQNADTVSLRPLPPGHFNVCDYGAIGNGVADDAPAIQAALNAMPTITTLPGYNDAGVLHLPPGEFYCASDIHVARGAVIRGCAGGSGNALSRIRFAAGKQFIVWHLGGPPEHGLLSAQDCAFEYVDIWTTKVTTTVHAPLTAYAVGDKRIAIDRNYVYLECVKAGTTGSGVAPTKVWQVTGTTFVDETTDAGSAALADFQPFPAAEIVGDYVAFGSLNRFPGLTIDNAGGTAGVGGTVAWEYWNGTAWAALPGISDATVGFTAAVANGRRVTWTMPTNWHHMPLNGALSASGEELFWVRARVTGTYSTNPVLDRAYVSSPTADVPFEPDVSSEFVPGATYRYGQIVRGSTDQLPIAANGSNLITSAFFRVTSPAASLSGVAGGTRPVWNTAPGATTVSGGVTFTAVDTVQSWIIDGSCVWACKVHAGIYSKSHVTIRNTQVFGASNAGIYIRANSDSGNANHSHLEKVNVIQSGEGIHVTGADANMITAINCYVESAGYGLPGNGGIGIWDSSFLNSTWIGCEVANASDLGGGTSFRRVGGGVRSVFVNCYTESYSGSPIVESIFDNTAEIIGGNWGGGITSLGAFEMAAGDARGCRNVVGVNAGSATLPNLYGYLGTQDGMTAIGWREFGESQITGWQRTDGLPSWPANWWRVGQGNVFYKSAFALPADGAKWPSLTTPTDLYPIWLPQDRIHIGEPYYADPPSIGFTSALDATKNPATGTNYNIRGSRTYAAFGASDNTRWTGWVCIANGTPGSWAPLKGGRTVQPMADANQTPTIDVYSRENIKCTGALTAIRELTLPAPATEDESYRRRIRNATTGGFAITVSTGAGTTVNVAAGTSVELWMTPDGVE